MKAISKSYYKSKFNAIYRTNVRFSKPQLFDIVYSINKNDFWRSSLIISTLLLTMCTVCIGDK